MSFFKTKFVSKCFVLNLLFSIMVKVAGISLALDTIYRFTYVLRKGVLCVEMQLNTRIIDFVHVFLEDII